MGESSGVDADLPGSDWSDPAPPSGATRWAAPAADYAGGVDGSSPWPVVDAPASVPPAVEPVTDRVGWLDVGRSLSDSEA